MKVKLIARLVLDASAWAALLGCSTPPPVPNTDADAAFVSDAIKTKNVSVLNKSGRSPLHIAVARSDLTAVEALLNAGASVNLRDSQGLTPITYLCIDRDYFANPPKRGAHDRDIAKLLMKKGANPDLGPPKTTSLVARCAKESQAWVLYWILNLGATPQLHKADPNKDVKMGLEPALFLCTHEYTARALVWGGFDPTTASLEKEMPMQFAERKGWKNLESDLKRAIDFKKNSGL